MFMRYSWIIKSASLPSGEMAAEGFWMFLPALHHQIYVRCRNISSNYSVGQKCFCISFTIEYQLSHLLDLCVLLQLGPGGGQGGGQGGRQWGGHWCRARPLHQQLPCPGLQALCPLHRVPLHLPRQPRPRGGGRNLQWLQQDHRSLHYHWVWRITQKIRISEVWKQVKSTKVSSES